MLWDAFFRRSRWERRLDAELRFHLEQQAQDYVANGRSREEAVTSWSGVLEERLRSMAIFATVAISDSRPPDVPLRSKPIAVQQIDGRLQDSPAQGTVVWRAVTPDCFHVLSVPIRKGRGFTEQDRDRGRDVMIVSQSLARRAARVDPVEALRHE
jgi:hypothetical protein